MMSLVTMHQIDGHRGGKQHEEADHAQHEVLYERIPMVEYHNPIATLNYPYLHFS